MEASIASSSVGEPPVARLMLTTDGPRLLEVTHSTAATSQDTDPAPKQLMALTGTISTPLATPTVRPPMMPATQVPWPSQSAVPRPSPTRSTPASTRPSNSTCPAINPVSTTYTVTPSPVAP